VTSKQHFNKRYSGVDFTGTQALSTNDQMLTFDNIGSYDVRNGSQIDFTPQNYFKTNKQASQSTN
jgi:hypothetical protein